MNPYIEKQDQHMLENPPDFGDGESILTLLYEAYSETNQMYGGTTKQDFDELYRLMNGMPLKKLDEIIYPVC